MPLPSHGGSQLSTLSAFEGCASRPSSKARLKSALDDGGKAPGRGGRVLNVKESRARFGKGVHGGFESARGELVRRHGEEPDRVLQGVESSKSGGGNGDNAGERSSNGFLHRSGGFDDGGEHVVVRGEV